jgi:serine kinase of HPr protein (carbohydrate metabolism regulator)
VTSAVLVHGTAVAINGEAILLRGPPGAGKSDLALRLIDAGARLVADDQTELHRSAGKIFVSAPVEISGLIEARGVGILRLDALAKARLALLVDLVKPSEIERLPESRAEEVLGISVPLIVLAPFEPSAAAKLRFALRALQAGQVPSIPGPLPLCGGAVAGKS